MAPVLPLVPRKSPQLCDRGTNSFPDSNPKSAPTVVDGTSRAPPHPSSLALPVMLPEMPNRLRDIPSGTSESLASRFSRTTSFSTSTEVSQSCSSADSSSVSPSSSTGPSESSGDRFFSSVRSRPGSAAISICFARAPSSPSFSTSSFSLSTKYATPLRPSLMVTSGIGTPFTVIVTTFSVARNKPWYFPNRTCHGEHRNSPVGCRTAMRSTAPPDSGSAVDTSATDPPPKPTAALPTIRSPERMLFFTRSIATMERRPRAPQRTGSRQ